MPLLSNSAWLLATFIALASVAIRPSLAAEVLTGAAHVVDGDTLDIGKVCIRLEGIDAPEAKQTCNNARRREWDCGRSATDRLERLTNGQEVRCEASATDDYGRIGTCLVAGRDINAEMIRAGLAWAFVRYSSTYVGVEQEARRAKRGVFEVANTPPWEYRAAQWNQSQAATTAASASSGSCSIKGNVSTKGEKIYHSPGQCDYERVKISGRNGERWFCSESEAQAAGWRKAVR